MPRTATTTAITHEGKDVLLHGKTVPLFEQQSAFRKLKGNPSHDEFKEVSFQESDGHLQTIRFLSPAAQKALEDSRKGQIEAAKAAAEKAIAAKKEAAEKADKERKEKLQKSLDANQNAIAAELNPEKAAESEAAKAAAETKSTEAPAAAAEVLKTKRGK